MRTGAACFCAPAGSARTRAEAAKTIWIERPKKGLRAGLGAGRQEAAKEISVIGWKTRLKTVF
jgi:hypothetical protein